MTNNDSDTNELHDESSDGTDASNSHKFAALQLLTRNCFQELERENIELNNKLIEMNKVVEDLENDNTELHGENVISKNQYTDISNKHDTYLISSRKRFEEMVDTYNSKLTRLQEVNNELSSRNSVLEVGIRNSSHTHMLSAEKKNESLRQQFEEAKQIARNLEDEKDVLKTKISTLEAEYDTHKHETKTQCELQRKNLFEINKNVTELQDENERLKAKISEMEVNHKREHEAEAQIKVKEMVMKLQDENVELKTKISTLEVESETQSELQRQNLVEVNKNVTKLQNENKRLKAKISDIEVANHKRELQAGAQIELRDKKLVEINENVVKLQNENEKLNEKISFLDIEFQKDLYQQKLELHAEKVSCIRKIAEANGKAIKLSTENEQLNAEIMALKITNENTAFKHKRQFADLMECYQNPEATNPSYDRISTAESPFYYDEDFSGIIDQEESLESGVFEAHEGSHERAVQPFVGTFGQHINSFNASSQDVSIRKNITGMEILHKDPIVSY